MYYFVFEYKKIYSGEKKIDFFAGKNKKNCLYNQLLFSFHWLKKCRRTCNYCYPDTLFILIRFSREENWNFFDVIIFLHWQERIKGIQLHSSPLKWFRHITSRMIHIFSLVVSDEWNNFYKTFFSIEIFFSRQTRNTFDQIVVIICNLFKDLCQYVKWHRQSIFLFTLFVFISLFSLVSTIEENNWSISQQIKNILP